MMLDLAGDLINKVLSGPFCCVIIIAPGLLIPIYRWLISILKREHKDEK